MSKSQYNLLLNIKLTQTNHIQVDPSPQIRLLKTTKFSFLNHIKYQRNNQHQYEILS